MKHYRIIAEQSDELTELFNRCDPMIAIVEGRECWLADNIDATQFTELREADELEREECELHGTGANEHLDCAGCQHYYHAWLDAGLRESEEESLNGEEEQ